MFKNLEGARLGIFVFIGTALLVLAIFLIGNRDSIFSSTIEVRTYFSNIEGLRDGAPVTVSGMSVGAISAIQLDEDSVGVVEVKMRIEERVKHLIRIDSKATIETEGLVGKKLVAITPGSPDLPRVKDGGKIPSKDPIKMSDIMQQTQDAIGYLNNITKDFAGISAKINQGKGTIGKLINDDQLYYAAINITESADTSMKTITTRLDDISNFVLDLGGTAETIMNDVDTLVLDLSEVVEDVREGRGILGTLISDGATADSVKALLTIVRKTATYAMEGAHDFSENMEALKHNWLFKHYFEKRGYYDKAEFEKELDEKIEKAKNKSQTLEEELDKINKLEKELEDKAGGNP